MSASWFLVSTYLIWIIGSKLILLNNLSSATLWVLDTCLIVGLLPFDNHFDHCHVVFQDVQPCLALRRLCVSGDAVHKRQLINISVFPNVWVWICDSANSFLPPHGLVIGHSSMNVTLPSLHPTNQEQVFHPCAIQHPIK